MSDDVRRLIAQKRAREHILAAGCQEQWHKDLVTHEQLLELMDKARKYDAAEKKVNRLLNEHGD